MVSAPGPGMWDFGLVCLIFELELVCLFSLLTWLSVVVIASLVLFACARDVGLSFLIVLWLIRCFLLRAVAPVPSF